VEALVFAPARFKGRKVRVMWQEVNAHVPETGGPMRLRQIVMNLAGNAVKFTETGGVTVTVGTQTADGRRLLGISVMDTGCGIAPTQAQTLFQPFTQADPSTSRRYGGTGLGLALARSLARALGGDVVLVRSAAAEGSEFLITIDIDDVGSGIDDVADGRFAAVEHPAEAHPFAPDLSGARVLVVDDTVDIRVMLEETLTLHGARVDAVGDGAQGIAMAAKNPYDVILMDIQLPEIDGYEVTRRLRASGTRSAVIALTGRASKGEHAACLAAGCDDYLAKPVSIATLVATAAAWRAKSADRV
jgi:CheY-like chemotaxis protein